MRRGGRYVHRTDSHQRPGGPGPPGGVFRPSPGDLRPGFRALVPGRLVGGAVHPLSADRGRQCRRQRVGERAGHPLPGPAPAVHSARHRHDRPGLPGPGVQPPAAGDGSGPVAGTVRRSIPLRQRFRAGLLPQVRLPPRRGDGPQPPLLRRAGDRPAPGRGQAASGNWTFMCWTATPWGTPSASCPCWTTGASSCSTAGPS